MSDFTSDCNHKFAGEFIIIIILLLFCCFNNDNNNNCDTPCCN